MARAGEPGGGDATAHAIEIAIVYCVVPAELASKLHEPLRRHFADDPQVEVVVERRRQDRRRQAQRRNAEAASRHAERRTILSEEGRRVSDRRAPHVPVEAPSLPRRAARYAESLVFLERMEPTTLALEDADTARLVTRWQAGEREIFGEVYMRYFDRVYSYVKVLYRDQHAAEDVTQQVFLKTLEALPRYERRTQPFRAWLFTIVRNTALQALQRERRTEPVEPARLDLEREQPSEELLGTLGWISDRDLLLFIERLPLPQRQVLVLRYLLDLPNAEIARILGRTPTDVRTLQSRALRFLSDRLVAVGKAPTQRGSIRMRRWGKPAVVARSRRFALL